MARYPGDLAEPTVVAKWMANVAENEYGLPGILPVMTSCVELTAAWTSLGDVKDVTGYLYPVDGCSVGYFQQQADDLGCGYFGWGTRDQLIDATYALRRFCDVAAKYKGKFGKDPASLGAWCQEVQRSAYPDRYEGRGYPLAKNILAGSQDTTSTVSVVFDDVGWAYDSATGAWLKSERKNATLQTNVDGWLWGEPDKPPETPTSWSWPIANDPPTSGSYVDRHPIRYTWRPDVEKIARHLVDTYSVWCNTYYDHPEGFWRTEDSIDTWGPGGRGDPIDPGLGITIFNELFNDPGLPNIEWIIHRATIYGAWNGWSGEPFGTDDFTYHYDHVHVTYLA